MATRKVKRVEKVEQPVMIGQEKSWADKLMPVLVVLLLVMAFALGIMWNKLQGGTVTTKSKYKSFEAAMSAIARQVKVKNVKAFEQCLNTGAKKAVVDADGAEGAKLGVGGTPTFFVNGRLISGAVPYGDFKKVIDQELGTTAMDSNFTRQTVDIGSASTRGEGSVRLIEYSDFQCPFCERVFPTVQQILKDYAGKVQLAYKYFPLTAIHPRAQKSAEAAECAKEQGKFWEFHDKLFETQSDWASL